MNNLKKQNLLLIVALIIVSVSSNNLFCMMESGEKVDPECVFEGEGKYIERDVESKKFVKRKKFINYNIETKDRSIFSCYFRDGDGIGFGLVALRKNGLQQAFMTHYLPNKTREHIEQIGTFCKKFSEGVDKNPIIKAVLVIMQPSDGQWSDEIRAVKKTPKYSDKVESLIEKVKKSLKLKDIKVKPKEVYYYSGFYSDFDQPEPIYKLNGKKVPREFEIVLSEESYYHSKASEHQEKFIYKD
jgi:hypothetical protein